MGNALAEAHQAVATHSFEAPREQASPTPGGQEIQPQTSNWDNNQGQTQGGELTKSEQSQIEQILELDKYDKFKWQGKEWSRDELSDSVLFRQDYTRKSQELAKQREYAQNVAADYRKVLANPALAADFKRLYPQEYHQEVDALLEWLESSGRGTNKQQSVEAKQTETTPSLPPEVMSRLDRVEQGLRAREQEVFQANVQSYKKEIDQICDTLSKKFEFADVDAVLAAAGNVSNGGRPLDEKTWENLFKDNHSFHQKRFESYQKKLVDNQKTASGKARDMGQGGLAAGSPPKKMNMEQAREAMLANIDAQSRR